LHQNSIYLARLWVNFVYIFFALAAYAAAATLSWRRSRALAGFGLLCFMLWGFVELIGVATNIFAVNFTRRAQYASSTPEVRQQLEVLLLGFPAVWDALFFVLLSGFFFGTFCFGFAAALGSGLERLVGVLFLLAVPLTACIMLAGYTSYTFVDGVVAWLYPVLQPLSRALLAGLLWRAGADDSSKPTPRP
jgi:hypothetical protein